MLCGESINVLLNETALVEPWAKYAWVRLIASDAAERISSVSGTELCKWYGVPRKKVSRVLGALESAGVLERVLSTSSGRGRPVKRYRLVRHPPAHVPARDWESIHDEKIKHLLRYELCTPSGELEKYSSDLGPANAARLGEDSLSVVDRLILAVLVCHANEFGLVAELGMAEIASAACTGQRGVKGCLERFTESGIISWRVHGLSSPILTRMKGVYLLNLEHACFGGNNNGRAVEREIKFSIPYPEEAHFMVRKCFKEELLRINKYIDWKICEYAAYLINECKMPEKYSPAGVDIKREVIFSDFKLGASNKFSGCSEVELKEAFFALVDDVNWYSYKLAHEILSQLSRLNFFKDDGGFKITVIPQYVPARMSGGVGRNYVLVLIRSVS
ncbi:Uncharacterised protein [Pseudomonas aeruginosa]|nr:Uncharacterised protein [Pseudomonas aeruginosa]